jgi:1-acyl-sn-glycerol-3-phosphate acyltransferase
MLLLRSLLFLLVLKAAFTVPFGLFILILFFLPPIPRYRAITLWGRMVIWLARVILGIRYQVEGLENLPREPAWCCPSTSRPGRPSPSSRSFRPCPSC